MKKQLNCLRETTSPQIWTKTFEISKSKKLFSNILAVIEDEKILFRESDAEKRLLLQLLDTAGLQPCADKVILALLQLSG